MKTWKSFKNECLHCGSSAEVLTDSKEDGMAYDGDEAFELCVKIRGRWKS